jgi:hypothetical protein
MDGAEMLHSLTMATPDYCFGITGVELYNNGYAAVYGNENMFGSECVYMLYTLSEDGLLTLNLNGVDVYYAVSFENGIFDQYIPSENVIASYVYDEIEMYFLGEYTGEGDYFVKYGGLMDRDTDADGNVTEYYDYVTIMMTLDLEAGTIYFAAMDETLLILPDGSLATPADDERRERYLNDMNNTWASLKLSYEITDEQHALYNELYDAILNAIYNEELRAAYDEFQSLVSKVRSNGTGNIVITPTVPGGDYTINGDTTVNGDYVINGDYTVVVTPNGGEYEYTYNDGTSGENSYATYVPAA